MKKLKVPVVEVYATMNVRLSSISSVTSISQYRMAKSIFGNAFSDTSFTRADMKQAWLKCDMDQSFALHYNSIMIGFVLIQTDPRCHYISYIAIDNEWKGNGLGTTLMKHVMEKALSEGKSLEVVPLLETIQWYKNLGFKQLRNHLYVFHRHGTRRQLKGIH